ncbi:MAG: hypothetical protein ACHQRM_11830 [Bacteroidia bacterium]
MRYRFAFNLCLLLFLFTGSVMLRFENMDKPLGRHHEWITAHTLITLSIWDAEGLKAHHFSPVYTYAGKSNAGIDMLGGVIDKNGRCYYTSYPPFAFLFPYLVLHPLGVPPSVKALQILNLLIHFFCALGIFLIMYHVYDKKMGEHTFLPGLIGFTLYIFSYGNLWFHMNLWFADILMQLFFIYGILLYLKIRKGGTSSRHFWLLGLVCFLGVYTEWLGLMLVMTLGSIELIRAIQKKTGYRLFIFLSGVGIGALALTLWQYSSISGFSAFWEAAKTKYLIRSGFQDRSISEYGFNITNPDSYGKMDGNYNGNYLAIVNLLGIFAMLFIAVCIYRRRYFLNGKEGALLLLILTPILLHHLIFFNFNVVHDFSTLKTSFLLITLACILSRRILLFFESLPFNWAWTGTLLLLIVTGIKSSESAALYHKNYDTSSGLMPVEQDLSKSMLKTGARTDLLWITNAELNPELVYYTRKNIGRAADRNGAEEFMKNSGKEHAVFFQVDKSGALAGMYLLGPPP